ncbi:hypothetical protein E0Z10_g5671 [Xylaria hypoxylon]|uniref:Uncharacterized protein n=1 Tax=Xylaria hypoxylon TaxID=37992 RepID=A0A4Z0YXE0_9PEZI|nr:hypothetical protein E0Z10_g5671 [Xylaria hypoxylon]
MNSLACPGWRHSSNALMKPVVDPAPCRARSSFKNRAFEYLKRKLAITKHAQSQEYRLRFLAGSPPPPLGQALGPDERVRTNISFDDYGFDNMLSDDEEDLDAGIEPLLRYSTASFNSSHTWNTSNHSLGYSIASISDKSIASEADSSSDNTTALPPSSSSSGAPSSASTSITEGTKHITIFPEFSRMGKTDATRESIFMLSPTENTTGGSLENEDYMFFMTHDLDSWSMISTAPSSEDIQHTNHAAALSVTPDLEAVNKKLEAWLDTATGFPRNHTSLAPRPPLRVHPRLAAAYGGDPNWAFWN